MPIGIYERVKYFGFKKGATPWNKGLKGIVLNTGRTQFKKGHPKPKNAYAFKKEHKINVGKSRVHSIETRLKMNKSSRKGEESNLWKGGLTKLSAQIRNCFEYKLWRVEVFRRDRFVCVECGVKGGKWLKDLKKKVILNADHIKKFSVVLRENNIKTLEDAQSCEELWDISNGRTLCIGCHKKTDTFGK